MEIPAYISSLYESLYCPVYYEQYLCCEIKKKKNKTHKTLAKPYYGVSFVIIVSISIRLPSRIGVELQKYRCIYKLLEAKPWNVFHLFSSTFAHCLETRQTVLLSPWQKGHVKEGPSLRILCLLTCCQHREQLIICWYELLGIQIRERCGLPASQVITIRRLGSVT